MNRHLLLTTMLLWACTATLHAQPRATSYPQTMYVIYDGAPLYDSAHHTSAVLRELHLGDSVRVLGIAGKFYRVEQGEDQGFIYWPNIAPQQPKETKRKKTRKKTERRDGIATPRQGGSAQGERRGTEKIATPDSTADSTAAVSSGTTEDRTPRARESNAPRCRGTTRSGRQCSRMANDPSGYCWQHRK